MAIPELTDASERLTDCIYFGDPLSASVGSGFVVNARTISTTAPLAGGGDLSVNRTLTITEFAGGVPGSVPTSLGGTVNFLRADGTWNPPAVFTDVANGYAPASGGGAVNYLRADGTWAAPPGAGIAGLTLDYIPVATSATTVGNSRILQTAIGYDAVLGPGMTANAGLSLYGDATYGSVIKATDSIGGFYVSNLKLIAGGLFTTYVLLSDAVYLDDTVVEGFLGLKEFGVAVANGLNSDISLAGKGSNLRLTGPTGAFSIGGLSIAPFGTSTGIVTVYNTTAQAMTIVNEDVSSTGGFRIRTMTGGNVTLPVGTSAATFQYSTADSRWILIQTNPPAQYPRTLGYVPYQNSGDNLADSTLFHDSANNRYGFATATPAATVDINGTLATRSYNQALSNGLNSDLPAPTTSYCRVTGPTGAFSVGGVITVTGENGKRLTIHNTTSQAMTIVHEDASSTAAYRINTLTAANVVFPARQSVVHLVYSTTTSRWILDEAIPNTVGGATTQVQFNSAGALAGDTGLVVSGTGAALALTLGTDVPLTRKATGHLELGVPGPAASAKKITAQSAIGGTDSNKLGGKLSIGGGAGTGTGGGGDTALITAYPGVLGNTQNPHVDRLVYAAKPTAMTDSAATTVATLKVDSESYAGGTLWVSVCATDGTDMQVRRLRVEWGAVNKASTITVVLGTPEEVDCTPVGTLTATITALDNTDDTFDLQVTPVSSLTTTVFEAWTSIQHDGRGTVAMA
jgi:hypothetical protein